MVVICPFNVGSSYAQELHTHSNAVSIANEANSTSGWGGSASRSSVTEEFYSGSYSIKLETPSNGWNYAGYVYSTTPNEQYLVKIYAKSFSANNPRIYLTGAVQNQTIDITSTNWTEYSGVVEASGSSMNVNVYTGTPAVTGDIVYIDHVSITLVSSGDAQAPSAPVVSSNSQTQDTVDLSWTTSTDNVGVTGYKVYQDGTEIESNNTTTSYQVTGLTASTAYNFKVRAFDAAGNESVDSNVISVTTNSSSDTQSPTAPALSSSTPTDTSVNLSWTAATDNVGVTGYKVYRDGTEIESNITTISYLATGLSASTAYNFKVRAFDAAGNQSVDSNVESVTTNAASGGGSSVWTESGSTARYSGEVAIGTTTVPCGIQNGRGRQAHHRGGTGRGFRYLARLCVPGGL